MRKLLAKLAVTTVVVTSLMGLAGTKAGAGELCARARLVDPLHDQTVCVATP